MIHGDCLVEIPKLVAAGLTVDSIITDPPYHLTPAVKRVGKPGSAPVRSNMQNLGGNPLYQRLVKGFMGQAWDGGDVAFRPETWTTIAALLRPGGFLLVFGGTRTWHRLACAIEDAGFVIQDTIMWIYGSGFPKGCTQLKPSVEPICVAYKPGGTRALGIDECRVPTDWSNDPNKRGLGYGFMRKGDTTRTMFANFPPRTEYDTSQGRWPANVCHDGSDQVMQAFARFDAPGQQRYVGPEYGKHPTVNGYGTYSAGQPAVPRGDTGTPARFFYTAKADANDRLDSRHPTVKPLALMRWLVPLVTPKGGTVLDPFAGSGSTGIAAKATGRHSILIEADAKYVVDIHTRLKFFGLRGRSNRQYPQRPDDGRLF